MKVSTFLMVVTVGTAVAVLYVFQQTEIFRLAYACQKNHAAFQELLDKNTVLRYNIQKSASLIRIGDKVSRQENFQLPDAYRLVKLKCPPTLVRVSQPQPQRETLVYRLFGIKREAEARTLNR
jgi:hypothetical protein